MRGWFAFELHEQMRLDKDIWVVTGDLGFGMMDNIKKDFPNRFVNVGASEQLLIGVGVGLADEGKVPIVYSITPFLLYRPFETIRNYVNREKPKVVLVGSGRNRDYEMDGFSHWAEEDVEILKIFSNINAAWPDKKEHVGRVLKKALKRSGPSYINLRR